MAAPTPWQARRTVPQPAPRLPAVARLRDTWPYVAAAMSSIGVFFMLFQIWMVAPDRDGSNSVDAFGTTYTKTSHLNLWSEQPPPGASVSGVWGILAAIAVFVTVFAAVQAVYRGTRTSALVTAGAAIAVAVFVIIDVLYIRSKMHSAQAAMKMSNDLGAHLGLVISALRGTKTYPWPGVPYELPAAQLTPWAYVTVAFAVVAACTAATRTWFGRVGNRSPAMGFNSIVG